MLSNSGTHCTQRLGSMALLFAGCVARSGPMLEMVMLTRQRLSRCFETSVSRIQSKISLLASPIRTATS